MSNNPTIDGVSRELLEGLLTIAALSASAPYRELRALLDAPAVERQRLTPRVVGYMPDSPDGDPLITLESHQDYVAEMQASVERLTESCIEKDARISEMDRIGSATIARLEARITQLESEAEFAAAWYQAARDRLAELEQDKARLDALDSNCWDVRFNSSPNGDAGDSSINIEVVGHWMDKPFERVIGENYSENLRAAIDQAMTAPAYPPERPEYPEPESIKDDDWHMNPCKQGHRDVGAAGGIAHCYTCDEKIEAATTQEAFERWNASHPVPQA